jgi:Flp pilus assembly protein TadG
MSLPKSPLHSLRRPGRGRFASESGIALVEFALVLPFLLLIIFAMVDLGKAVNYWNDETHLANSAARYASVNGCTACGTFTINSYVMNTAATSELKTNGQMTIAFGDIAGRFPGETGYTSPAAKNHCVGQPVKVTVSYPYTFFNFAAGNFEFLKGALTKTIRSTSTQRIEKNWGNAATGAYDSTTDRYTATGAHAAPDPC